MRVLRPARDLANDAAVLHHEFHALDLGGVRQRIARTPRSNPARFPAAIRLKHREHCTHDLIEVISNLEHICA